jgi:hypothetical protein
MSDIPTNEELFGLLDEYNLENKHNNWSLHSLSSL